MKIERINENNIIVFLNKYKLKEKIIISSNYLEEYFRTLFKILKNKYNIEISGYYSITLYQDNIYGAIIDIKKDFVDYFDYYDNQVDMKIDIVKDSLILYRIDSLSILKEKTYEFINIYLYDNNIYIKPKKNIGGVDLGDIIENSTIIYGDICNKILKVGKIIKSKYTFL